MTLWIPNFSWVTPDLAAGGAFPQERAADLAAVHGLGAVVDLRQEACDEAAALEAAGIWFLHLPTEDLDGVSQPMLDRGVDFARRVRKDQRRLLIHCEHGIGRSATLLLCVLVDRGLEPMSALRLAKDAREHVSPSQRQYEAWAEWIGRRGWTDPGYHEFGMVAYRHLAKSA